MRKSLVLLSVVFALVLCLTSAAMSADFDFLTFAKEKVLTDFHPTSKPDDATVEYDKEPSESDGVASARVRIFYKGWTRKHEMVAEINVRPAIELVNVKVLADTNGVNITGGKTFKDYAWIEMSYLNKTDKAAE